MYKKVKNMSHESFGFISEISYEIKKYTNQFINQIEYSLLNNVLSSETSNNTHTNINREFYEQYINQQFANKYTEIPLTFTYQQCIEILDCLLTEKIESLMVTKASFEELEEKKSEPKKRPENFIEFKEFIKSPSKKTNYKKYIRELDKQYNANLKTSNKDYFDRPLYFILYRLRNNLLSNIDKREFSTKLMEKLLKELNGNLENELNLQILHDNYSIIDDTDKVKVFWNIVSEIKRDYLNDFRMGKTFEEGNSICREISELLTENNIEQQLKSKALSHFIQIAGKYNEDVFKKWIKSFIDLFNESVEFINLKYKKEKVYINYLFTYEKIRKIFLSSIFQKVDDIPTLIKSSYANIAESKKKTILENSVYEFLLVSNFTVAVNVKDLKVLNQYFNINFGDINILSHELFEGWQYGLAPEDRERILITGDNRETTSWILIKNIFCSAGDTDTAVKLANEKVENFLNVLYYFISREDEMNYKIIPNFLVYNNDTKNLTWTNTGKRSWEEPKLMDDLEVSLIQFLNKYNNLIEKYNINQAISNYIKFCRSDNVSEKVILEVNMIKKIFITEDNIRNLAALSAIYIAGTNYEEKDVTYHQMRLWLYEDFIELFYIAGQKGYEALKERIIDRFKVFCKNIIGTVLFNMVNIEKNDDYDFEDILEWILYINPANELIGGDQ